MKLYNTQHKFWANWPAVARHLLLPLSWRLKAQATTHYPVACEVFQLSSNLPFLSDCFSMCLSSWILSITHFLWRNILDSLLCSFYKRSNTTSRSEIPAKMCSEPTSGAISPLLEYTWPWAKGLLENDVFQNTSVHKDSSEKDHVNSFWITSIQSLF